MASKARDFRAGEPVEVVFRWAFRLTLFAWVAPLVKRFLQLLAKWALRCGVAVLAYEVRPNHAHLTLVQDVTGHRRCRGIAAMMRNVLGALGISANVAIGSEGRIVERTYRSSNLRTYGALLRHLAYITHQDLHHDGPALASSRDVTLGVSETDGIVTTKVVFPGLVAEGASREEYVEALGRVLLSIAERAVALEREAESEGDVAARARGVHPWRQATQEVGEALGLPLDAPVRQVGFEGIGETCSAVAFFEARRELREWQFPSVEVTPRNAPAVGDVIEVRVVHGVRVVREDGTVVSEWVQPPEWAASGVPPDSS